MMDLSGPEIRAAEFFYSGNWNENLLQAALGAAFILIVYKSVIKK